MSLPPDIPGCRAFVSVEPISAGCSGDGKYHVETAQGRHMFVRVADVSGLERRELEYRMMARVYDLGPFTAQPLGFGVCNGGKSLYALSGWLEGEQVEHLLPRLPKAGQHQLGIKAGALLRTLHTLSAPHDAEPWGARFGRRVRSWIEQYRSTPGRHAEPGALIIGYLEAHAGLLDSRPQTFVHGDFNTENILVQPGGHLAAVDFNSYHAAYGDPWHDLDNMSWMPTLFPHFYSGQIRGYFGGAPPEGFWDVFTYYLAYDALAALTDPYGLNGLEDGSEIVGRILQWTDSFKSPVPGWYTDI